MLYVVWISRFCVIYCIVSTGMWRRSLDLIYNRGRARDTVPDYSTRTVVYSYCSILWHLLWEKCTHSTHLVRFSPERRAVANRVNGVNHESNSSSLSSCAISPSSISQSSP